MPAELEGGCACGQVRYRLETPPMFVNCCHCTDCQRQTGSAFVINAVIETARVHRLSGETNLIVLPTDSGRPHRVARCTGCGTAVWSHYGGRSLDSFVRVGTLDTPSLLPPEAHIYTRSKLPWVVLPSGVPVFEEFYSLKSLWPAASLARRAALYA